MFLIKDIFTKELQGLKAEEIAQVFHLNDLKMYAKVLNIKNRSRMNKAELSNSIYAALNIEN